MTPGERESLLKELQEELDRASRDNVAIQRKLDKLLMDSRGGSRFLTAKRALSMPGELHITPFTNTNERYGDSVITLGMQQSRTT